MLGPFPLGINSGLEPLLLEPQQLSYAINCTVRGGYVSERPPIFNRQLDYGGNADIQKTIEKGFFQGVGHYRPDFGQEQLVAQISGRLFTFTEQSLGGVWKVNEITVPGDPNDPTVSQVWMWQSEKWLVISDGSGRLPIFYDGVSSRRSAGPSVLLDNVVSTPAPVPPSPPAIGSTVTVTLATPWTGPYNVPVLFNGEYYQPVGNPAGVYEAILTNVTATAGNTVTHPADIVVKPASIGYVISSNSAVTGPDGGRIIDAFLTTVTGLQVGSVVNIPGTVRASGGIATFTVTFLDPATGEVYLRDNYTKCNPLGAIIVCDSTGCHPLPCDSTDTVSIPNGALVTLASNNKPNVIVGITTQDFTIPIQGQSVTVFVDRPYTGPADELVWIGNDSYTIVAVPTTPSGLTLHLINLTDTSTLPYDFSKGPLPILSVPELPAGRMGAYGLGQNWMSLLDGQSFIFSDPLGGATGTQAYQGRDAVLKTVGLTFQGGSLRIPNTGDIITAMIFTATLDASLGQGALLIGTDRGMFSVLAPFDPTRATNAVAPILTQSLVGRGPLGQNSTVQVNNDTIFRSVDGLASLVLARREFNTWGNVPISREVTRALSQDLRALLPYGSSIVFDNRLLHTCFPQTSGQGVFHEGLVALNFDSLSNLRTKAPSCYDGLWTGINTLQLVAGPIGGVVRGFAFINNTLEQKIQLYELRPTGTEHYDINDFEQVNIDASMESPVFFNQSIKPMTELIRIRDGEIYIRDLVVGKTVVITVEYRPDFYPCWVPWRTFTVCNKQIAQNPQPGYRMRLGLGEPPPPNPATDPPELCEAANGRPFRVGNFFQVKVSWSGHLEFMGFKMMACTEAQPQFARIECDPICAVDLADLLIPA